MGQHWPIKCTPFLSERENIVLQWEFGLSSALATAETWHLTRLFSKVLSHITFWVFIYNRFFIIGIKKLNIFICEHLYSYISKLTNYEYLHHKFISHQSAAVEICRQAFKCWIWKSSQKKEILCLFFCLHCFCDSSSHASQIFYFNGVLE